ncbi:MAG: rhodanese-like domain-containing protein [Pseudomonadota bacterium]
MTSSIKRVGPKEAWQALNDDHRARLIDVRSTVEFKYVGHPLNAVHVVWKEFPDWEENAHFGTQVAAALGEAGSDAPIYLICRSGARSFAAAERLAEQGYTHLHNVEEGFEGDRDDNHHRGTINGWRFHGLPWEQG